MINTYWFKRQYPRTCLLLMCSLLMFNCALPALAQEIMPTDPSKAENENQNTVERLQSIGNLIDTKIRQREKITAQLRSTDPDALQDERARLTALTQDLESLRSSFELVLLDDVDTELMTEQDDTQFNWRQELVEVVEPLLISLKSLTRRPRQLAELRNSIDLDSRRLAVTEQALQSVERVPTDLLNKAASDRLAATREKWLDARNLVNENLLIARSQLDRLENSERPFAESLLSGVKSFIAGRGLTLLLASAAAILSWACMRICWHVFHTRLTKRSRRKATWYRLLAYSYHLFTLLVVVSIVLSVLYLRQDVLLLALSFLLLAVAVISLRTFLPRFLAEVRLLLNLGAVREEECVIHAGLPWQVMSINIQTVLRNPALEGVIRLPLSVMTTMVSRPVVRDELWFPTLRHDYIFLPDRTFAQIMTQTPELIELSVKGGMSMTIPTAEFYAMSAVNLSRHERFGIPVTFGLDYSLQQPSLSSIPDILKAGVLARLAEADYRIGKDVLDVLVELKSAGASSLDFLIYTTVNCRRASDYYALERLILQACVYVANEEQWVIPFPQLTLHHQTVADALPDALLRRAA